MINRALLFSLGLILGSTQGYAQLTPEQAALETLRISKKLKPISNEKWERLAGERSRELYPVVKGDTLWGISKRLFGDGFYWPKIWALNNQGILNPHKINPGDSIAFWPGSGSSLPSFTNSGDGHGGPRSGEWKLLPENQDWETPITKLDQAIDPDGFDQRSKITFHEATGRALPVTVHSEKLGVLGSISKGSSEAEQLGINDVVYAVDDEGLKVGKKYSVVGEPESVGGEETGHSAYVYQLKGEVLITGANEDQYAGKIINQSNPILRGDLLVELISTVKDPEPKAGNEPLEAGVTLDPFDKAKFAAEHSFVLIDRGEDDGVNPGMVFRAYQKKDPSDQSSLGDPEFVRDADFLIIQSSNTFSLALVSYSNQIIEQGQHVILLTDLSEILAPNDPTDFGMEVGDDLDGLDDGKGLSDKERKELRQLEKWKEPTDQVPEEPQATEETPPTEEVAPTEEAPPQETVPTETTEDLPAPEAPSSEPAIEDPLPPEDASPSSPEPEVETPSEEPAPPSYQ